MQAAKEHMDNRIDTWMRSAGKMNADRSRDEEDRLDRDEQRYNLKMEAHWAQRDQRRKEQEARMWKTVKGQEGAMAKRKLIEQQMNDMEGEAVAAQARWQ